MSERPRVRITTSEGITSKEKEIIEARVNLPIQTDIPQFHPDHETLIKAHERELSDADLEIFNFANRITSEAMQRAGIAPLDVPVTHCHILPREIVLQINPGQELSEAYIYDDTEVGSRSIIFIEEECRNPVLKSRIAVHEFMHMKSHMTIHAHEYEGGILLSRMRDGISVMRSPKAPVREEYFQGLHEAVVETKVKLLFSELLNLPVLKDAKEWLSSEKAEALRERANIQYGVSEDEISWIEEVDGSEIKYLQFSYPRERAVLRFVCEEISKDFKEQFPVWTDVYKLFEAAHYNGRLLEIARLVETVFGKGSFRRLGDMSTKEGRVSARVILEELQTIRSHHKPD